MYINNSTYAYKFTLTDLVTTGDVLSDNLDVWTIAIVNRSMCQTHLCVNYCKQVKLTGGILLFGGTTTLQLIVEQNFLRKWLYNRSSPGEILLNS